MNDALKKQVLSNALDTISLLIQDLPKELLRANVALWGTKHNLKFSIDQFRKDLEEANRALLTTSSA